MFIFFSRNKVAYDKTFKKAQLAPFFIALIAVAIIIILFTVNLSKIALVKTHTANAVDAGALAAASQAAFAFNQLAFQAMGMYGSYLAYWTYVDEFYNEARDALDNAIAFLATSLTLTSLAASLACIPYAGKYLYYIIYAGQAMLLVSEFYFLLFTDLAGSMDSTIDTMYDEQSETYVDMRDTISDNFDDARDSARDYIFLNSGISEKLSDSLDIVGDSSDTDGDGTNDVPSQADEFSYFVGSNVTPSTFCWRDGMEATTSQSATGFGCQTAPDYTPVTDTPNRLHVAGMNITDSGPPQIFQLIETDLDHDEITDLFDQIYILVAAISIIIAATIIKYLTAEEEHTASSACYGWIISIYIGWVGPLCIVPGKCLLGIVWASAITAALATIAYDSFYDLIEDIWYGIQEGSTFCDNDGDTDPSILVTVTDVDHVYELDVDTFQEHQGQDLGFWQTRYPRVKSDARADYSCDVSACPGYTCNVPYPGCNPAECGDICNHTCSCVDGKNPCIAHDPILVGVDESL